MTATQRRFFTFGIVLSGLLALPTREAAAQVLGACCSELGCLDLFQPQCQNLEGTWLGDGTSCEMNDCDFGACCLESGCQDMSRGTCRLQGGTFFVGESCANNPCSPGDLMGACCASQSPTSFCYQDTQANCEGAGRFFAGVNLPCSPNPCGGSSPTAACCTGEGCVVATQADCDAFSGQWLPTASNCSDTTCLNAACCTEAGCTEELESECQSLGGQWFSGLICADDPCNGGGMGACCAAQSPTAFCYQDTQQNCEGAGRFFIGVGIPCDPNPCGGTDPVAACCTEEGCVELTQSECNQAGGAWLSGSPTCNANTCTVGRCCLPNNDCLMTFSSTCQSLGGVFDANEVCPPGLQCEQPATGACCAALEPGSGCTIATQADCENAGRTFIGVGSVCTPTPCHSCQTCPGDVNNDGVVNGKDAQAFVDCLLAAGGLPPIAICDCADINMDFVVNNDDINPFVTILLQSTGPCGG